MLKICSKCKEEKTLDQFSFKLKNKGILHKQCKTCTRILIQNHYNTNKEYYINKAVKRNSEVKLVILRYLRDYLLSNPCVDCGEKDITVLEFDHNGKVPKFKAVSSLIRDGVKLDIIKKEVEKCDVRCANCHRRKTAVDFNWIKNNMRS
ncbi:MAG: hypothetical protein WC089_02800 [Candidatus Paceibacterota bacterium]